MTLLFDIPDCKHTSVLPDFDIAVAVKMSSPYEVREKYPRFRGECPTCGVVLTLYASTEHYLYGDW